MPLPEIRQTRPSQEEPPVSDGGFYVFSDEGNYVDTWDGLAIDFANRSPICQPMYPSASTSLAFATI